ncbi:MAG: cardiolipin synthase [Clostridiales bacterium]|jgi:cardiolipin synthase|nr:cardiolipin synthase [Clostridiales bacterium]
MNKRPKKHFLRSLLRRRIIVIFLLLLQLTILGIFLFNTSRQSAYFNLALTFASLFVALYVVNNREKGAYKLIWSLQILVFPFFGGLFYLLFHLQGAKKKFRKAMEDWQDKNQRLFYVSGDMLSEAKSKTPGHAPLMHYLQKTAGYPLYGKSRAVYLSTGEEKYEKLLAELEKAERYIFLEYFIIQEGKMWDAALEILARKVNQGLDVRVMYDDMGCFLKLPKDYPKRLEALGIRCTVFGPFIPVLSARQNNRDHRKIAVIDGRVAFTGGVNFADEYINAVDRFGHWKDTAIMVEGEAAWSFTLMFLQLWTVCNTHKDSGAQEDYALYDPWKDMPCATVGGGYVQPYADSPMDEERVGENVYLHIINTAKKYVYINTPYLVIDDVMVSALCLAARSGVDVRIVTPHRPDKRYVHAVTRSFYRELIRSGVRVYEYTAGFLHAKSFVSDDCIATVGTANLDYRSLYLHFECGLCVYQEDGVIAEIREDFLEMLPRCEEVTEENSRYGFFARFIQDTLRLLSPLL